MNSKFRYILVFLVFLLVYEVYLVVYYEYEQYQTNSYVDTLKRTNDAIIARNQKKQELMLYTRTPAYQSYIAKATQNKKLPGEEVTNIVDRSSVIANENIDVGAVLSVAKASSESPMRNMKNPEKWVYMWKNLRDYL